MLRRRPIRAWDFRWEIAALASVAWRLEFRFGAGRIREIIEEKEEEKKKIGLLVTNHKFLFVNIGVNFVQLHTQNVHEILCNNFIHCYIT